MPKILASTLWPAGPPPAREQPPGPHPRPGPPCQLGACPPAHSSPPRPVRPRSCGARFRQQPVDRRPADPHLGHDGRCVQPWRTERQHVPGLAPRARGAALLFTLCPRSCHAHPLALQHDRPLELGHRREHRQQHPAPWGCAPPPRSRRSPESARRSSHVTTSVTPSRTQSSAASY